MRIYHIIHPLFLLFITLSLLYLIKKKNIPTYIVRAGVIIMSLDLFFMSIPCFYIVEVSLMNEVNIPVKFIVLFALGILTPFVIIQAIVFKTLRRIKGWRIIQTIGISVTLFYFNYLYWNGHYAF